MNNLARILLLSAVMLFAGSALAQQPWRVYPPDPVAGEPFVIQYEGVTGGSPASVRSASVSVQGSTLVYAVEVSELDFAVPGAYRASTVVPGLAAGTYQVQLQRTGGFGGNITSTLGTIQVAPAGARQAGTRVLSGNWFDPKEPGWGMNIVQGGTGALFAAWLTYWPAGPNDTAKQGAMWLVMPDGRWLTPTRFRGLLYSTYGTTMSKPFNRADLAVTPVGYVTFDFSALGEATMKAEAAVSKHVPSTGGLGIYAPFVKEAAIRCFQF